MFERALAIREQTLGETHPVTVESLHNLAVLYIYQGIVSVKHGTVNTHKFEEAELLFQRVLEMWERSLGPEHPYLQTARENYAIHLGYREAHTTYVRQSNEHPEDKR